MKTVEIGMRRWVLLVLAGVGISNQVQAAHADSRALDQIPLHVLSTQAVSQIRASLPEVGRNGPARLALTVPMALGVDDGSWQIASGQAIWRARVYSAGATLLIAHFDRFDLPDGAELYFSDTSGETVQGPYRSADHVDGSLWTAMVPGEEALIEVRTPQGTEQDVDLRLANLGHGVYPMRGQGIPAKSGSCNVDVACPQAGPWANQVRSAVRVQIPGATAATVDVCSGQLVNNSAQNDKPYVLTANHCGITGPDLLSTGNAGGVVVYFNYQTSSCGGTPNGSLTQNVSGSTLRFSHVRSDHTLIELDAPPPPNFNAYYSGLDATANVSPSSGISLHHPSGDEKRISFFNSTPARRSIQLASGLGSVTVDVFDVNWSQGVTEQGSSGGGLWNQNRNLVGVLSGGAASCADPNGTDAFGRLEIAWANGIAQFLDPASLGRVVAGKNPGSPPPPDADGDLVPDATDQCPNTPAGTQVDSVGCPLPPPDADGDLVPDASDQCPNTPPGTTVNAVGCPVSPPPPSSSGGGGGSFGLGLVLLCVGLLRRWIR